MSAMFITDSALTNINYGSNFVHNSSVVITDMFNGTEAPKPPHTSWQGVSFSWKLLLFSVKYYLGSGSVEER